MSRSLLHSALRPALFALLLAPLAACTSPEQHAQNYLKSAQELLAKGDVVKANLEFRNALKHKKDLVAAWRGVAQIEEQRQNWGALGPILRTIVEYDPSDMDARLKLGRLMLLAGAFDQAMAVVTPASDVEKPSANALTLKAAILFGLKETEGAVREANRALSMEPDNLEALMILAGDKVSRGDPAAALQLIERGKVLPDSQTIVHLLKAQIFEQMGDQGRVEAELQKLVASEKDGRNARSLLVNFYLKHGRDLDAERELRTAASADPANVGAYMDVVRFVQATKGPDAARRELEDRIKAGGDVFPYQLALAEFDASRGDRDGAITALEKLVAEANQADRKASARISLARIHLSQKSLAPAEAVIAEVLKADNRNVEALRLRAIVRLEQGQLENAIADLRQALNDQPNSAPLLQLLASALERTGAMELAEKHHADATRVANFEPGVALQYVSFLQRRRSAAHAEDVLTEVANRHPKNLQVLTTLAQLKLQRQDWVGAQETADAIKLLGDQRGIADQIRGVALSGQNKLNESVQALHAAFQAAPNNVQPMIALVRGYMRAQKPNEAETFLKGVLAANPANAEALVLMGSVQLAMNAPDRAEKYFKEAIERQPRGPVGYSSLAEFHLRRNEIDRALQSVRAGLEQQPQNFGLRLMLASGLERKGDVDGAIKEYEAMLVRQPDSLIAANNLATLLADHRPDKASLERAQTVAAILRKSNVPHFKDTLGWLSYHQGDYRTAMTLLEEAVEALPNHADVRYHLGMTYLKAGQAERGQEHLKKAAELSGDGSSLKGKALAALRDS